MNSVKGASSDHDGANRRRPGPQSHDQTRFSEEPLRSLANRVYLTYHVRLAMAKRLQVRGLFWDSALVALSLSTLIGSIGLLLKADLYGPNGQVIFVVISVFMLVSSLMVASARYVSRSRSAFDAYRELQRISSSLWANVNGPEVKTGKAKKLHAEADLQYQRCLDQSDNHSQGDFASAVRVRLSRRKGSKSTEAAGHDGVADWDLRFYPFGQFSMLWAHRFGRQVVTLIPCFLVVAAMAFSLPMIFWMIRG